MKNLLNLLGFLILLVFLNTSCEKDYNTELINNSEDSLNRILTCIDKVDFDLEQNTASQSTILKDLKWEEGQVLKIKFLGGTPYVQENVKQFAKQWEEHANINFEFINDGYAEIRISFTNGGSWSYIGKDALKISQNSPTMNFGWFNDQTSNDEFKRVTLHEFGHALGIVHEHQHPNSKIKWNKPVVYSYYYNCCGWDANTVDRNIFDKYSIDQTQYSEYDALSIMHYPIPNIFTLDNFEVGLNKCLSSADKCFVEKAYPFQIEYYFSGTNNEVRGGRGWYIGDFNGDGKDDIFRYLNSYGGAEVFLSNGDSFENGKKWSSGGERGGEGWYVGDFNGDGKDDILRYLNSYGGAEVCLSNGSSFEKAKKWSGGGTKGGRGWYVGDFNGDGKDDIFRYLNSYGGAEVCLSKGNSFENAKLWSGGGIRGGEGWYVGDFNGDGKDDIFRYLNSNGGAEVCLSNGNSFEKAKKWSSAGEKGGRGWYVGDYNGDGKDDIFRYLNSNGGAQVSLSRGNSFGSIQTWSSAGERGGEGWYIGDFDGDGKDDIFRYLNSNGGAQVFLSNKNGFKLTVEREDC